MRALFVTGLRSEARIATGGITLVSGANPARLKDLLDRQSTRGLDLVVSFGLAGGLKPGLAAGTLVLAHAVVTTEGAYETEPMFTARLAAHLPEARVGLIAGLDMALTEPEAKARVHEATGALAVDMESHLAAAFARRAKLPFLAIRAISDDAGTTLPPLARVAIGPEGELQPRAMFASLKAEPGQWRALPALALGSFLAHARLRRARAMLRATISA